MNGSFVHTKIETIPTRQTGYALDVDKGSGNPSLPQDMADRVVAVIRAEYERLDRNKAALGRFFSRSPQPAYVRAPATAGANSRRRNGSRAGAKNS